MTTGDVNYQDVQGVVRFGYKRMTEACYALLKVRNPAAARSWLRSTTVTTAEERTTPPPTALQVAFTAPGLQALGLTAPVLAGFAPEFLTGMTEGSRSRRLGDVGVNAPTEWEWGYAASMPHILVMFFAEPGRLAGLIQETTGQTWSEAFEELRWLDTGHLSGHEPFGFVDGISQPEVDWKQQRRPVGAQVEYSNVVALGEFLLGYRNEYGLYTDRPVLPADPTTAMLAAAEDAPEKKDLGLNGTYLVLRQLRQDVRGFWQFILRQAGGDKDEARRLASLMVGRTIAGDPLLPSQDRIIPGTGTKPKQSGLNEFTFDADPAGLRCPLGAHIRRSNPRNADFPGRPGWLARLISLIGFGSPGFRDDLTSSVRFHRLLRRGREYGPGLPLEEAFAPAPANDPERGLRFICLNASISRQFEFLQNAWIINTKFAGLSGESDPLLGNREALPGCPVTHDFTIQEGGGLQRRLSQLPRFVTVRGGAYFFLPSLRALTYIAGAGTA